MAGWTVVPNGETSAWKPVNPTPVPAGAKPITNPDGRMDTISAPSSSLADALRHPLNLLDSASHTVSRPTNASVPEMATSDFQNLGSGLVQVVRHPLDTIGGMLSQGFGARPVVETLANKVSTDIGGKRLYEPAPIFPTTPESGAQAIGAGITLAGAGEGTGAAMPAIERAGSGIRTAAIGDADAAGLRGLRVGSGSPKSLSTISAIKGSRPFLKGVTSLEDLQTRIPVAKAEIWGPYQKTIDAIGGKEALGPDGPTTISALEAERQQLSALNRGLKQQNPEAIQLAQQKGMTQAQLLDREKAIQQSLDPYLEKAGIDPKIIRKTFGQVSQIGSRASGKSTLAEKPQPFGFGKMTNLSIEHPLQAPAQILSGARDLVAGRPLWSGKPTDIALREAFRTGGEKPNFGAYRAGPPPLQLEANVPGNAPYGENYSVGPIAPIEHPIRVTAPPPTFRALPAATSATEPQPMIRYARPYVEPYDPKFSPTNIEEYLRSRGK